MGAIRTIFVSGALLIAGAGAVSAQFSDSNEAGLPFLRIAPSAANASLGCAGLARPDGAASLWLNPSLLSFSGQRSAQLSHTELMEGIRQDYAALSAQTGIGSLAASIQLYDSGDMEGYGPDAAPTGAFSIKYVALSLGYARRLTEDIAVGVAYKKLYEKMSDENADGYALDAGITWKTPVQGLTAAAVARNYGRMSVLKNARTRLPSDYGAGILYRGTLPSVARPFAFAADYVVPRYGDSGVRLGVEVEPVDRFAVRLGYRTDNDYEDVSFGVGLNLGKFSADVSYTPMEELSDNALRFTLSFAGF